MSDGETPRCPDRPHTMRMVRSSDPGRQVVGGNDREEHKYFDYAGVTEEALSAMLRDNGYIASLSTLTGSHDMYRDESNSFPARLHYLIQDVEADGLQHIIEWCEPHGRCFIIHDQRLFFETILPL